MREDGPTLPRWLETTPLREVPAPAAKRRRRRGFLEKTLHEITEGLKNEIFSEYLARKPGLLQGVDPRAKLVTTLLLIGAAGMLHHILVLFLFNLWLFWLARTSLVPLGVFAKRVWIVVPLFTGILVFPALFNVVRPGTPLLVLFHLSHPLHFGFWTIPREIAITHQGVAAALLLVLRVGASVSLAILLTLTTRWPVLLKAFSVFRIPDVFISVLEMTYRYVFLLLQISSEMFTSRRSRLVGRTTTREQRRFVTSAMGNLWGKTQATSEEVHSAMLARGYTGVPRSLAHFKVKSSDWLWMAFVLMLVVLTVGGDRVLG